MKTAKQSIDLEYKGTKKRLNLRTALISLCMFAFVGTSAQTGTVTVKLQNASVKELFSVIEKQTSYRFSYRDAEIKGKGNVTISATNRELKQLLEGELSKLGLKYAVSGNKIIVTPVAAAASAQPKKVTGKVVDANGEPVIGATIKEQGTANGTITDFDGNFALDVADNAMLEVSYIGYKSQELKAVVGKTLSVTLKEDTEVLDEVVVVGYGTQKKANLTGAVSSVSTKDLEGRVETDILKTIQGTVPGVTVISRPGETPTINFRGRGNLGTSEPLYVIDGAIADATFFSSLDPSTIESVSFLKDAASSSIYGARAAYGVVLVTTKTGKKDKFSVNYSGNFSISTPTYLPDVVDSWEYAELLNEGYYNRGGSDDKYQVYSPEEIGWFKDGSKPDYYPNTNWVDLVLDKYVASTKHSVNFTGGSEKIRYFMGMEYLYKDDFIPGRDRNRYNLNASISSDITDWLSLHTKVKYINSRYEADNAAPALFHLSSTPCTMVAKQSNGEWGSISGGTQVAQVFMQRNPLRTLDKKDWQKESTDNIMFDLGLDLRPVKGLVLSTQFVYRLKEYKNKYYTALQDEIRTFEDQVDIPGTGTYQNSMSVDWQRMNYYMSTTTAKYDLQINNHSLNFLLGTSYEDFSEETLFASRKNFPVEGLEDLNGGSSAGVDISNSGSSTRYRLLSGFGRVNYNFSEKYLFELNLRMDSSSRFHKNKRLGVFPSFSAGWRLSEENFLKSVDWMNNLKFRFSWGQLGNINNVGNYDYLKFYALNTNYNFSDKAAQGISTGKEANDNLGWETVTLTDVGLDFDGWNGLLSASADFYVKNTEDILLSYNVPSETGIMSVPSQNIGKVRNIGMELSLSHRHSIKDFSYSIGANISYNKNEIIDMGSSDNYIVTAGDKIRMIFKEGESVGAYYGYKTDGLYTQEEIDAGHYYKMGRIPNAGDIKYVPQRENVEWGDELTGEDRTIIGKNVPDFTYGINVSLNYRNWELSLFGQGVSGTKVAFESDQIAALQAGNTPKKYHLGRWTQENPNPNAVYPRIYGGHSLDDYNLNFSEFNLFDADYFRIKSILLGYMIPKQVTTKWGISSLKVFISAENLFTFRADKVMKDFDPEEAGGRGLKGLASKSVALGLNLSF